MALALRFLAALGALYAVGLFGCSGDGKKEVEGTEQAWGVPERIDGGDQESSVQEGVDLAVNAHGVAIAAWLDSNGGIWTNRYAPGKGWAAPEPIEKGEGYPSSSPPPQVAISRDGTAMLVWLEYGPDAIRGSRFTPSGGWGATKQIDRGFENYGVNGPDVAMDDNGNAIATWRRTGDESTIFASRYTATSGWGSADRIDDGSAGYDYGTRVAMSPTGSAIAVWQGDDGKGHRIFANQYTPDAGWATSQPIGDSSDTWTQWPVPAMDGSGNGLVVWWQDYEAEVGYFGHVTANSFTPDGGWQDPGPIEGDEQSYSYGPHMSMNADGTAVVVWAGSERGDEPAGVWSIRYEPDGGWSAEELVEGYPLQMGSDFYPQVAVDPAGNALAVWNAYSQTGAAVFSSYYTVGDGWDASVRIDLSIWYVRPPRVGIDDDGDGVAAWHQSTTSGSGVFANRYAPDLGEDHAAFWQPVCNASCERESECSLLDGQTAAECTAECVDELDRMPCEPNQAAADACIDGLGELSCEDLENDWLPYTCNNVCFGDRLCEGRTCDDQNDCTADSCDLADGRCVYAPVADGTPCADGAGVCQQGSCASEFPCSEQGIRDAIALGGGPHTFACSGSQTVTTTSEIVIDKQVILDGDGRLTVSGNDTHRVFHNQFGLIDIDGNELGVELRGFAIVRGRGDRGGGIYNSGRLILADCTVSENMAAGSSPPSIGHGGGIYNDRQLTLIRTLVSDNVAGDGPEDGSGGGIYNEGALTLTDSSVVGNSAAFSGGGLYNERYPEHPELPIEPVRLTNCTVAANTVEFGFDGGGGIMNRGPMVLSNCTVTGNSGGAAISAGYMTYPGTIVSLVNSTVSANVGAGIAGEFELFSTTISGNAIAGGGTSRNSLIDTTCTGSGLDSQGGNLESPGDTCGLDAPSDLVNVPVDEVALGTLKNNGGPTMTQVPAGAAPIDKVPVEDCVGPDGAMLATDQRGVERPQGASCDIGAVEVSP